MRSYPYFMIDGLLVAVAVLLLVFSAVSGILFDYLLLAVTAAFIAWRYVSEKRHADAFDESVSCIKGLDSWDSDFFSLGTLILRYRGERAYYSSEMGRGQDGVVVASYTLALANPSKTWFDIRAKADGRGFEASGDRKFFARVKDDIENFDRKYEVVRIRESDGLLRTDVRLAFSTKPLEKEEKSAEMCEFLEEYLEFALALNRKLKTG